MEENKKNKLGLGILIGVLVTLVIVMGTFIVYDKVLSKDADNEQLENGNNDDDISQDNSSNESDENIGNSIIEEVKDLSLSSDLVKNLHELSGSTITTSSEVAKGIYGSSKLMKDLSLDVQESLLYIQLIKSPKDNEYTQDSVLYSQWYGSTVKSLWAKIFGSNTEFKLSNKTVNSIKYQSDGSVSMPSATGRYEGPASLIIELKKATQSDKEIVLYEAVKFSNYNMDTDKLEYFLDVNMTQPTSASSEISINYKKVFKKDTNGNYYFYSVEKIN